MKRILIALLLVGCSVPSLLAQRKGFAMGFKGGVNLSQLSMGEFLTTRLNERGVPVVGVDGRVIQDNLRESFDSQTGWAGGIWMRFGRKLYIQPEAMVSSKGGSFEVIKDGRSQYIDVRVRSIDVPVLFGMKASFLRLNAGPMVSFPIDDNQNLRVALRNYTTGSLNDALAKAVYGYQLGGGIDIGSLSLDVRHEAAISDFAAVNLQTPSGNTQFNQRTKSWQVTLALKVL
jgi:hypothetical protein